MLIVSGSTGHALSFFAIHGSSNDVSSPAYHEEITINAVHRRVGE